MLLHVSIACRISSSGNTYCSLLKSHVKIMILILTRDFSKEQYVLPEDDMRYAIETCRGILSVLV